MPYLKLTYTMYDAANVPAVTYIAKDSDTDLNTGGGAGGGFTLEYKTNGGAHFDYGDGGTIQCSGDLAATIQFWLFDHPNAGVNRIEFDIEAVYFGGSYHLPKLTVSQNDAQSCLDTCLFDVSPKVWDDLERQLYLARPEFDDNDLGGGTNIDDYRILFPYCDTSNGIAMYYVGLIVLYLMAITILFIPALPAFAAILIPLVTGCHYLALGFEIRRLLDNLGATIGAAHNDTTDSIFTKAGGVNENEFSTHSFMSTFNGLSFLNFLNFIFGLNYQSQKNNFTGKSLLDLLMVEYNLQWRVINRNGLRLLGIKRKSEDWNIGYWFELDGSNYDRSRICWQAQRHDRPSYGEFKVAMDSMDGETSHEKQYSDYGAEWNSPYTPAQKGKKSVIFEGAGTAARLDGTKTDEIERANESVLGVIISAILSLFGSVANIMYLSRDFLMIKGNTTDAYRIVDWDDSTPRNDARVRRMSFTVAGDTYYHDNKGYEGQRTYTSSGSPSTECVNGSVFVNAYLHSNQTRNRYSLFECENPRHPYQAQKKWRTAELSLHQCSAAQMNMLGAWLDSEVPIDYRIKVFDWDGWVQTIRINYLTGIVDFTILV